jgi:hypothetical protein
MQNMGFLTWDNIINVNEQTGSFLGKIAKKAGVQMCRIYRKYPGLWNIQPGQKAFLNQVCPPLGEPPGGGFFEYEGGQCGFLYTVTWRYGNSSGVVPTLSAGTNIASINGNLGPIASINTSVSGSVGTLTVVDSTGTTRSASGTMPPADRIKKIFVRPPTGSVDNCGNPSEKPLPPDETVDNNDFNFNFTTENNYPTVNTNYNDLNFTYVGPPTINFPFKVKVGEINFKLDLDGADFGSDTDSNDDNLNNKFNDLDNKLDDLDNKLDDLDVECICKEPYKPTTDYDVEVSPTDEEEEEEVENDPEIAWVLVEITSTPIRGSEHSILQNNADDSTFFAGYFSWTYGEYRTPEEPIRKIKNAYKNTIGADGFRLYTVNGARVKYTILRETSEEE